MGNRNGVLHYEKCPVRSPLFDLFEKHMAFIAYCLNNISSRSIKNSKSKTRKKIRKGSFEERAFAYKESYIHDSETEEAIIDLRDCIKIIAKNKHNPCSSCGQFTQY